ncbi:MAG: tRNA dihydrouridine(20/20a) synthase DusA [Gammaproteobacteria bacterium]|nr:tRNA dihydrouridine(20/20a) synthase DusA [Gammaproteobacteria bacterium]
MLDWTDQHCRYWLRLLFPDALLYSEMVAAAALIHGDVDQLLMFNPFEKPLALQLGGNEPNAMARCAEIAQDFGYDEVNINVGCPSDRVQAGAFGACLMAEPDLVADCVSAMQAKVSIPVTVKTRLGIDKMEGHAPLQNFVACIAKAGCGTVIVHARKAWLSGLSPKENREIPPLRYDYVYRLKQEFPQLEIVINGGIMNTADVVEHLGFVDGTMVGREAYQNPYALIDVQSAVFNRSTVIPERAEIVARYLPYVEEQLAKGVHLNRMTQHMMGLFQGCPGAKQWRRHLSEHAVEPDAGIEVITEALRKVRMPQENTTGAMVNES